MDPETDDNEYFLTGRRLTTGYRTTGVTAVGPPASSALVPEALAEEGHAAAYRKRRFGDADDSDSDAAGLSHGRPLRPRFAASAPSSSDDGFADPDGVAPAHVADPFGLGSVPISAALAEAESRRTRPRDGDAAAAAPADAAAPLPGLVGDAAELMYVPISPLGISDEHEEKTDDPEFCFLCICGPQPGSGPRAQHMRNLENIISLCYVNTSPKALTDHVQSYYNKEIRPKQKNPELRKPWYRRVIWDHIQRHRPTAQTITYETIRVMSSMMHKLAESGLCLRPIAGDGVNTQRLDLNNSRLFLQLAKSITPWLARWDSIAAAERQDATHSKRRK